MFFSKNKLIIIFVILALFFVFTIKDLKRSNLKIVDGDTIHLNGKKIRFSGIDTPELKQKCTKNGVIVLCGINAKKALIDKVENNIIICLSEGKDRYNRILAECFVNSESLSSFLVKSGHAFAYSCLLYTSPSPRD